MDPSLRKQLACLSDYSSCDVADALLQLGHRNGGFLPSIRPIVKGGGGGGGSEAKRCIVGEAVTLQFRPKSISASDFELFTHIPASPWPADEKQHWADLVVSTVADKSVFDKNVDHGDDCTKNNYNNNNDDDDHPRIVVLAQPPLHQRHNAVVGGLAALRLQTAPNIRGVVVSGSVRDAAELRAINLPVWAKETTVVGMAGYDGSEVHAWQVPVWMSGAQVSNNRNSSNDSPQYYVSSSSLSSSAPGLTHASASVSASDPSNPTAPTTNTLAASGMKRSWDQQQRDCELRGNDTLDSVLVHPRDIIVCDGENEGVVVVPRGLLESVVDLLPKLAAQDDRVKEALRGGESLTEAIAKHRK